MVRKIFFFFLLTAALAGKGWAGPADVPVAFTNTQSTAFGQSVFVLGSIPQLGNWDPTRAIKMRAISCNGSTCTWALAVALPEGASYEFKYVVRSDCATCYSDAGNIIYESGANRTGNVPAGVTAPFSGKTAFYYSGWSSVSILYSNTTSASFVVQPMLQVSNGLWRADGLNRAGESNLVFVFTDNQGHYDNPDGIGGLNYETPLDAFVVRNGQVYNYWPPAFVSTNRVETFSIGSTNVTGRTIRVYLPRGYNENTTKRYPVLYMHDGQNLFLNMGNFGSWHSDTNANNLIRFAKMRETIIVGVDNSSDRFCEYAPPGCTYSQCGSPRGDKYAAFLVSELKPVIDANYRTLTGAEDTGIMGSSLGGLISLYLGWQFPSTYHRIGAMSSSVEICLPVPAPDTKRPIRVYLDSGDRDTQGSVGSSDDLSSSLDERDNLLENGHALNIDLDHTIGYGHWHNELWWDARTPRCFTFLFPTSDEPNTVLDTAYPPRITSFALGGASNAITWTSFRLRNYVVEGATNATFSSSMTWSNLFSLPTETLRWNYPGTAIPNSFRFLRVRESVVSNWVY